MSVLDRHWLVPGKRSEDMSIMNKLKTFFTMDEEDMYADEEMDTGTPGNGAGQNSQRHNRENVVNLTSIQQPASKVVLYEPRNYNEAQEIADNVVNNVRQSLICSALISSRRNGLSIF